MSVVYLATLAQARQALDVQVAATGIPSAALNDAFLMQCVGQASRELNEAKIYPFAPELLTRLYNAELPRLGRLGETCALDYPLLERVALSVDGTVIPNDEYGVIMAKMGRVTPYTSLYLKQGASVSSFWPATTSTYVTTQNINAISVSGVWGWHNDWAQAWLSTLDAITTSGGISASATSFTVADVDGVDAAYNTPRLSAGNLIKIGAEYMVVLATDTITNTVTVMRGAGNTTPQAHLEGASISTFMPDGNISGVTAKYAAYLYSRRGNHVRVTYDGVATTVYTDKPDYVTALLASYPDLMVFDVA